MSAALMLDTSFLITLVDDNRAHHNTARQYYQHCLENEIPLHVSTLALAEFAIKQVITDLPLTNFRIEPFNVRHAVECGKLWAALMPKRDPSDSRAVVKTDLQLLAQAHAEGIPLIATEDAASLSKYTERAKKARHVSCDAVLLSKGFDSSWFNNGQKALGLPADE